MDGDLPTYEVFAVKYAEAEARPATDFAIGADPHEAPVELENYRRRRQLAAADHLASAATTPSS